MAKELKGSLSGEELRVGIVVGKFNEFVTHRLLEGAREALSRHGVAEDDVTVAWVPGSFEIPLVARTMAQSGKYDAVVCLGAVIRGETAHFEHVASQAAGGVARASQDTGVPVMFGILTTENMEQAINRAGGKAGNHGYDWAVAAIEMATLMRQLRGGKS